MKRTILVISKAIILLSFLFSFASCEKDEDNKNNDATLSGIFINSNIIENFNSEIFNYDITLEFGTNEIPELTVEANDPNAQITIIPALEIPGVAIINIIAEDGQASNIYMVNFKEMNASTDATLKSIQVHGVELEGFNVNLTEYQIELPEGTTIAPTVSATANDEYAIVTVTQVSELPGTATIIVTAQDTEITKEYTIEFTLPAAGFENIVEILTSHEVWLCTHYVEQISGVSDTAPDGSMFFTISYSASGSCMFSYGPNPEDQVESTWEVNASKTKITYAKGTEDEYSTTILQLTQSLFEYNDAWTTSDGTNVDYIFTLEPYTGKFFNNVNPKNSLNKRF
jgi:hypothetical protein